MHVCERMYVSGVVWGGEVCRLVCVVWCVGGRGV